MATEQSTVELKVVTDGLAEAQAGAQKLHDLMKATAEMASNIRVPNVVQAAQEQVAATNGPRRPRAVAAAAEPGSNDLADYRTTRGLGGTGAEGRDFAKQASGLGGLVHVYATFAANLFAVSAAFTALSKAADTTNMIKGLDQLGAQSGRALGGVAKAMVDATGGALSLKEAMGSTALASSAGMTNAAMLRMTEVAKKASLALGRDMGDSMDRLTKGIAKVQPELLDELGIMTRVIPAQEKYAREVGKSVDALTDFEKRLAFANAVLEEGEKKFGSITIDTNPYTQLAASLANVAQGGLELVNKVLGPLVEGLAKSPTGLSIALTGIAGILLKQAIPALGQYRKGLEAASAESLAKVARMQAIQGEAGYDYDTKIVGERAKQKYLLETGYAQKSADEQKKILEEANKRADKAAQDSADRATSLLGHETTNNKIRDRLYQDAAVSQAKYTISQTQGAYGMTAAFAQLREELTSLRSGTAMIDVGGGLMKQAPQIGIFRASLIGLTSTIGILGSAIGTIVNAFQPWILLITAVSAGVAFLVDHFRTATKEIDAAGRAADGLNSAVKTVGDTLDAIAKKPFLDQISNASIQAKATALNELTSSLQLLGKRTNEAYDKLGKGGFSDRFQDARVFTGTAKFISSIFTGEKVSAADRSNLSKQLSDGVQESLVGASKLVEGGRGEESFRASIKQILGITYKDSADLEQQLSKIPDALIVKLPRLQKSLESTNKFIQTAASAGKELDDAWTAANKSYDNIITSLTVTDPLGKLGDESVKVGIAMTKAFEDPKNRIAELSKTATEFSRLRFLSPETQRELLTYAQGLKVSGERVDKLKEKLKLSQDRTQSLKDKGPETNIFGYASASSVAANQAAIAASEQNSKNIQKQIDLEAAKQDNQDLFVKAQDEMFAKGAKLVEASIGQAFGKAAVTLSQALVANTGNTKEGLRRQAELQKQMIDVESANLDVMLGLVRATNELTKVQEELLIQEKTKALKADRESGKIGEGEYSSQKLELDKRAVALARSKDVKGFKETVKDLSAEDPTVRMAAQRNYALVATTEHIRAQKALNDAKKQGIDLDTKSKEILLDVDAENRLLDLNTKLQNLKHAQLGIITQSSSYENKSIVLARQDVEEQIALNNQRKEELAIEGQIRDEQERRKKARDPRDIKAIDASIAKFRLDLSQKQDMFDKDKQMRDIKAAQELKANQIAEFNYARDFEILNNTISTENLAAIQSTTTLYLEFVQQQKASIELSNIRLNFEKQSNAELQNQIALQDRINKIKADPKADPRELAGAQQSLAESVARSSQLQMKYASDVANINIKNLKIRLDGEESIRKKLADIAFAEIDSANKIALIKLDGEEKLIQAKLSLGQIAETTAARMTAEIAQSRFRKELETQAALEKKTQDEEAAAKKIRESELQEALKALNQKYENDRVEQARVAQEKIDKLKQTPVAKPGETGPGLVTKDVLDTQIKGVGDSAIQQAAASRIEQLSAEQELKNKANLLDKEALNTQTQRLALQSANNTLKAQELEYAAQIAEQQSKLNQLAKDQAFYTEMADSAAKSFAAGLGDAGKALGDIVKILGQTATATDKYNIDRINAEKAVADTAGKSAEDQARDKQNLAQIETKYYAQRIDNFADIAQASAGFFDKNSKQYQQMLAIEKIVHLAKLAYMAIEQAAWIKNWVLRMLDTKKEMISEGAGSLLKAGSGLLGGTGQVVDYGLTTGTKAVNMLGGEGLKAAPNALAPTLGSGAAAVETGVGSGVAAGAGAGAAAGGLGASLMAAAPWVVGGLALLSLFGGGGGQTGPSAADKAKLSGTGRRYNAAGDIVETGTGALGDSGAANEAIKNSIDYLGKINYENLQFDKNKALVALEAIRDNTANFVKAVGPVGSIGNLTAGGVKLGGGSSGFLGFGSSSTSLEASGIKVAGTIGEIADKMGGSFKKFEDIKRESSSFWGLVSDSSTSHTETDVGKAAEGFIRNTVGSFREAITASAKSFGQDGGILKPIIDQIDISFTAYQTGETGAQFADRVQQELGNKLDEAVKAVFPGIDGLANKFQKFGETLSEFAMRVQGDSEQIKFAFESIGQKYIDTTGGDSAGAMAQRYAEQTLVKAFGGSQELFSAIDKYGNSMLTEAQRLAPVRDEVNKKLVELFPALSEGGKSLITTREQFDNLRKSLDPLDPATQDTWMAMTKLGPAFASITEAAIKLTDVELKKAQQDQYVAILNLKAQMNTLDEISKAKALAITRQRELDGMDALLKPTQLYIYALQDEATAKDKLQASYDKVKTAIGGTIDSLKTQITTLQDYKKTLQLSDKGNLTPQEAYAASKGQLESAAALAQQTLGEGASKADIAARDKAVSSLPNLIDQFLAQSKTSFASGDQYQADYSWVNSLLDTTTAQLDSQKTDAEKQLDAVNSSVGYLTTIDDSTKTTANLMAEFLANQKTYEDAAASVANLQSTSLDNILSALTTQVSVVPAHAMGGLASQGVNLVGEQGPELVDFANPGRVYTAGQTAAFGDNTALVAELKALRDEVAQLRSDQKEQTGHIIQSNYDANNRNAQAVSNVTENAIKQQAWKERSQVVIA